MFPVISILLFCLIFQFNSFTEVAFIFIITSTLLAICNTPLFLLLHCSLPPVYLWLYILFISFNSLERHVHYYLSNIRLIDFIRLIVEVPTNAYEGNCTLSPVVVRNVRRLQCENLRHRLFSSLSNQFSTNEQIRLNKAKKNHIFPHSIFSHSKEWMRNKSLWEKSTI